MPLRFCRPLEYFRTIIMKKFYCRIYEQGSDRLLAVSDSSIIGKTFEDGELRIDVSDFYRGEECSESEAIRLVKSAIIVNAVGKGIVALMLKEKIITKDGILEIKGVPHAQVVAIK